MDFIKRNELIEALELRGFESVDTLPNGWQYRHADGFTLSFRANGAFELITPDEAEVRGTAQQPSDILILIDKAAAAL